MLLPLLGITYMLFFVNPGEDEISRIVFIYFNSFLESFQVWSSALASIPVPPPRNVEEPILWLMPRRAPTPSQKQTSPEPRVAPKLLSLGVAAGHSSMVTAACLLPGLLRLCLLLLPEQRGEPQGLGWGGSTPFLASRPKLSPCTELRGCWHRFPGSRHLLYQPVRYLQLQTQVVPIRGHLWSISSFGGGKSTPENRCSWDAPV